MTNPPPIQLRELNEKDYRKAIRFAVTGMHFDWYMDSRLLQNLYGRYFLYLELSRATQVIAAYYGDELAGLLLAQVYDQPKPKRSFWKSVYIKIIDWIQNTFVKEGVGAYDQANQDMLAAYKNSHHPDGEIIFLAANPDLPIKGIGTLLLGELEKREPGKEFFLYTDNACTYQFYERRGFERSQSRDIEIELGKKSVPLTCMLFSRKLG